MSEESPLRLFLDRLLLRSDLSVEEQDAVLNLPHSAVLVKTNHDFVRLRETVTHACLVTSGIVSRFVQNSAGLRQIVAFHIPGDMADLHSVVLPQATSALQALTDTTIVRISHKNLHQIAATHPGLARAFWRDCTVDAAVLSQWAMCVGRRNARAAISHLFCEMATRYNALLSSGQAVFRLPITQFHLADALALTSVHVSRVLSDLRKEGLVDFRKYEVKILNWHKLAAVGEFDARYLAYDEMHDERDANLG